MASNNMCDVILAMLPNSASLSVTFYSKSFNDIQLAERIRKMYYQDYDVVGGDVYRSHKALHPLIMNGLFCLFLWTRPFPI